MSDTDLSFHERTKVQMQLVVPLLRDLQEILGDEVVLDALRERLRRRIERAEAKAVTLRPGENELPHPARRHRREPGVEEMGPGPGDGAADRRADWHPERDPDAGRIRGVLRRAVEVVETRRRIELDGRPAIPYDVASLDVGSSVRGLELPGVREHALATRPIRAFVDLFTDPISYLVPKPDRYLATAARIAENVGDRGTYSETVDSILYGSADSYAQLRLIYLQTRRHELGQETPGDEIDPLALDTEGF